MKRKTKKKSRDLEKQYPLPQFIAKLRRLADALETRKPFSIQIARERIAVPARAIVNIEHERDGDEEEVEFQIKWSNRLAAPKTSAKVKRSRRATPRPKR